MISHARVVVTGLIAQHPLGGVTWDYLQYPLGLSRLGHDVYYIEDSGEWPYKLEGGATGDDFGSATCNANVAYLASVMSHFGLSDRWAYRCPVDGAWHGLSDARRREILRSADLLLNISGTLDDPSSYRGAGVMAYIDSDPVFTQIKLAKQDRSFRVRVDAHDIHFSFGECLPSNLTGTGHRWIPTRQPVVLDEWRHTFPCRPVFTTVMNWASYKSERFEGRRYGQKDLEFARFIDLPAQVAPTSLEIAGRGIRGGHLPGRGGHRVSGGLSTLLRGKGWHVVDTVEVCSDFQSYRRYIQSSKAEWSVAKNGYVEGAPGWFSCRSACYLAAGRPVVVQDTGFGGVLPTGEGLLKFNSLEEAAEAIGEVESDYPRHASAALQIAEEYFSSDKVLGRLIETALSQRSAEVAS